MDKGVGYLVLVFTMHEMMDMSEERRHGAGFAAGPLGICY